MRTDVKLSIFRPGVKSSNRKLKQLVHVLRKAAIEVGGAQMLLQHGWLGLHETRRMVAEKYLTGHGLAVGALGFPLILPSCASAIYLDKIPREQMETIYPNASDKPHVDPDRVEDGFFAPKFSV